jgi:hypothetical protein
MWLKRENISLLTLAVIIRFLSLLNSQQRAMNFVDQLEYVELL